jgi:hypothetical protein
MGRFDNDWDEENFINKHDWPLTDELDPTEGLLDIDDEDALPAAAAA